MQLQNLKFHYVNKLMSFLIVIEVLIFPLIELFSFTGTGIMRKLILWNLFLGEGFVSVEHLGISFSSGIGAELSF